MLELSRDNQSVHGLRKGAYTHNSEVDVLYIFVH